MKEFLIVTFLPGKQKTKNGANKTQWIKKQLEVNNKPILQFEPTTLCVIKHPSSNFVFAPTKTLLFNLQFLNSNKNKRFRSFLLNKIFEDIQLSTHLSTIASLSIYTLFRRRRHLELSTVIGCAQRPKRSKLK